MEAHPCSEVNAQFKHNDLVHACIIIIVCPVTMFARTAAWPPNVQQFADSLWCFAGSSAARLGCGQGADAAAAYAPGP